MRYSKDHKAATHARIVQNASVLLREKGARGVGVADLMKGVGLTHGGFYAHFGSRDDLVNEAIASALDQNAERWKAVAGDGPLETRLLALIDFYLSAGHRDRLGQGCALAALAADVSREGAKTRRTLLNKLDDLVRMLASEGGRPPVARARQRAIATIATLMGTLVLARIAGNGALSQEFLEAGKSAAHSYAETGAKRKLTSRKQVAVRKPKEGAHRAPLRQGSADRKRIKS